MEKSRFSEILKSIDGLAYEEQMEILDHLLVVRDQHDFDAQYIEVLADDIALSDKVAFALKRNEQSRYDDACGRWTDRFNGCWEVCVQNLRLWEKAALWCAAKKPFLDTTLQAVFLAHCDQARKYFAAGWRAAAYQIANRADITLEQVMSLTQTLLSDGYLRLYIPRGPETVLCYWTFGSRVHESLEQFDTEAFLQEKAGHITDQVWRIWIYLRLAHRRLSLDELSEKMGIPGEELYRDYLSEKIISVRKLETGGEVVDLSPSPTSMFCHSWGQDGLWEGSELRLDNLLESELAS